MRILPSTGEHRRREAKRLLILDLFQQRGPAWNRIQEMRERWGVEARTQLPPRYQGGVHTPDSLGPRPPDEEQFTDEAEEWYGKYREWTSDLAHG